MLNMTLLERFVAPHDDVFRTPRRSRNDVIGASISDMVCPFVLKTPSPWGFHGSSTAMGKIFAPTSRK